MGGRASSSAVGSIRFAIMDLVDHCSKRHFNKKESNIELADLGENWMFAFVGKRIDVINAIAMFVNNFQISNRDKPLPYTSICVKSYDGGFDETDKSLVANSITKIVFERVVSGSLKLVGADMAAREVGGFVRELAQEVAVKLVGYADGANKKGEIASKYIESKRYNYDKYYAIDVDSGGASNVTFVYGHRDGFHPSDSSKPSLIFDSTCVSGICVARCLADYFSNPRWQTAREDTLLGSFGLSKTTMKMLVATEDMGIVGPYEYSGQSKHDRDDHLKALNDRAISGDKIEINSFDTSQEINEVALGLLDKYIELTNGSLRATRKEWYVDKLKHFLTQHPEQGIAVLRAMVDFRIAKIASEADDLEKDAAMELFWSRMYVSLKPKPDTDQIGERRRQFDPHPSMSELQSLVTNTGMFFKDEIPATFKSFLKKQSKPTLFHIVDKDHARASLFKKNGIS